MGAPHANAGLILHAKVTAYVDQFPTSLSYCTNVHPGRSVAEVLDGLDRYTVPVQNRVGKQIAAGLWLAQPVVEELLQRPGNGAA